jgi:hypothetical protein
MNTNPSYVSPTLKTPHNGKVFTIDYSYSDPAKENEIENMLTRID